MVSRRQLAAPGAVALVGSGEYLDGMNEVDTYLLETLGGASSARVVLLPTASGLEPNGPTYWNRLGQQHFQQLGVGEIRATNILDRTNAADPEQLALLQGADLYYFSGGNPEHVIETLRDTPAWHIIKTAYEQGAVLAGCSAGAMMLCGHTISIRQAMMGSIKLVDALSIVPGLIVFPHFDRMARLLDQDRFRQVLLSVPDGSVAVGVDEDTALVRIQWDGVASTTARWRVMGRQSVTIFTQDASPRVLSNGEEVIL